MTTTEARRPAKLEPTGPSPALQPFLAAATSPEAPRLRRWHIHDAAAAGFAASDQGSSQMMGKRMETTPLLFRITMENVITTSPDTGAPSVDGMDRSSGTVSTSRRPGTTERQRPVAA